MPVLAPQTPPPYEEKLDRICKPADLDSGARSGKSGALGTGRWGTSSVNRSFSTEPGSGKTVVDD